MARVMDKKKSEDELVEFIDGKRPEQRLIRSISFPIERLSRAVDLRPYMSPIEEQGDMNTW